MKSAMRKGEARTANAMLPGAPAFDSVLRMSRARVLARFAVERSLRDVPDVAIGGTGRLDWCSRNMCAYRMVGRAVAVSVVVAVVVELVVVVVVVIVIVLTIRLSGATRGDRKRERERKGRKEEGGGRLANNAEGVCVAWAWGV